MSAIRFNGLLLNRGHETVIFDTISANGFGINGRDSGKFLRWRDGRGDLCEGRWISQHEIGESVLSFNRHLDARGGFRGGGRGIGRLQFFLLSTRLFRFLDRLPSHTSPRTNTPGGYVPVAFAIGASD